MDVNKLTKKVTSRNWKTIYYENDFGEIVAKVCSTCEEVKRLDEFTIAKKKLGGRDSRCRTCRLTYYKENKQNYALYGQKYREENREKDAERKRKWRKENLESAVLSTQKRRARKKSLLNNFTNEQMIETLNYFGGCALTGRKEIQWDHVIPLTTGHGGTIFGNMIPLNVELNQSKHTANIFEWFKSNKQRYLLSQARFDKLIQWLAITNNMTIEGYRNYIYKCHEENEAN